MRNDQFTQEKCLQYYSLFNGLRIINHLDQLSVQFPDLHYSVRNIVVQKADGNMTTTVQNKNDRLNCYVWIPAHIGTKGN